MVHINIFKVYQLRLLEFCDLKKKIHEQKKGDKNFVMFVCLINI